jgi:hypothetical protein
VAKLGRWMAMLGKWVAKWVAKLGKLCVANLGRWVAKQVARLLRQLSGF